MAIRKDSGLTEFIPEAEELIETFHKNLQLIQGLPNRSEVRPDTINAIFRAAHTLKGMAGMVGLAKVSQLSHSLEDMLDKIRMGKLSLTDPVLDVLHDGVDLLQKNIQSAAQGDGELDIASLEDQVKSVLMEKGEGGESTPLDSFDLDPSILKILTEYESHRLFENIKADGTLYEIKATFKLETFDTDLARLNAEIQKSGEIISTLPSPSASMEGGMEFRLIVGSPAGSPALAGRVSAENIIVREISKKNKKEKITPSETASSAAQLAPPGGELASESGSIRSLTQTVRVEIDKLDSLLNMVGELVLSKAVVSQISKDLLDQTGFTRLSLELAKASKMLDKRIGDFQEKLVEVRMIPIGHIFDRLQRTVRKLSKDLNKEVNLLISGEETKMDKAMVEDLADPLLHLIRNALDHGLENREERLEAGKPEIGTIYLRAIQKGSHVLIEVEDDGKGIDADKIHRKGVEKGLIDSSKEYSERDLLNLLFLPGFSTKEAVTEVSGRGVGLDVVGKNISKLAGLVDIETVLGQGTLFRMTLPITLVIIKALIITIGPEAFAVPLNSVSESLMISTKDIKKIDKKEVIQLRDHTLLLVRLNDLFSLKDEGPKEERLYVIVVGLAEKRVGLVVNEIQGQQEVVIKSLGGILKYVKGISGATELGNRKTILVLDVAAIIDEATQDRRENKERDRGPVSSS